jgi:succinate dehydrogenase / fumarate reductase, flavoprotein subunit
LAYNAGADLMDLEFTQFHPTGMVWPPSVKGTLVTEGVRGDGGILLNRDQKRFMFDYIPDRFAPETADSEEEGNRWLAGDKEARRPPELLTRDVVARAIMAEVKAGRGSEHGGAYLDIASRLPAEQIKKKLPSMYHQFMVLGELDITRQPMEVGPTLHYFMGGIRVDHDTQSSTVPGLFACGECAAGLHGANRLGGNSLSDLLVFGRLSGIGAAEYIRSLQNTPQTLDDEIKEGVRSATDILNRESGTNPYLLHEELQDTMQLNVGIVRDEEGLKKGLDDLEKLKKDVAKVKAAGASQYNPGWHEAISLQSMVLVAEGVARSALMRTESRGGHTRLDHEGEQDEWLKYNTIVRKGKDGNMEIEKFERPEAPEELKRIASASLDNLEAEVEQEQSASH